MAEITVAVLAMILMFVIHLIKLFNDDKLERNNRVEEELIEINSKEVEELSENNIKNNDEFLETFNNSIKNYKELLNNKLTDEEKPYIKKLNDDKEQSEYIKKEKKKLIKYVESIKLREIIYKIFDYTWYESNNVHRKREDKTYRLYDGLTINIECIRAEIESVVLRYNNKYLKISKKNYGCTLPDGEYYSGSDFLVYDIEENILFKYTTHDDECYIGKNVRMGNIDMFKNGDWVIDISMLYENIITKEKSDNLSKKYSTSGTQYTKENFDIN